MNFYNKYNCRFAIYARKFILLFLITLGTINMSAQTKAEPKISIMVENQTLDQIFKKIEGLSDFQFSYGDEILKNTSKYSVDLKNTPLSVVLDYVASEAKLEYKIQADKVSVRQAEKRTLSGKLTDAETGEEIIGATIRVKGSATGAVTDVNGNYSLSVYPFETLQISYIGYETKEVQLHGQSALNEVLSGGALQLNEVVITALGIAREEKALGYSVSKVNGDEINRSVSGNWLSGLEGKVAGLTLGKGGGTPGGSMRVTLRGDASLNYANNEALFVVDGIPISSGATATVSGANYSTNDQPVDYGNGASELNPDDIESVTVLKGPAASALYGSRAANGAIIITTKSSKKGKGVGVTVNSSISFEKAGYFPDFQTEYGPGNELGESSYSMWTVSAAQAPDGIAKNRNQSTYAFGEKFDANKSRYLYASYNWEDGTFTKLPWVYADDWYTGFFKTGITTSNTVSIDGSNGNGTNTLLSFTDFRNNWIMPNTGYKQKTVALTFNTKINDYIDLRAKVNYDKRTSDNMPTSGYSRANPMYSLTWGQNVNTMDQWKTEYFNGRYNYNNLNGYNELEEVAVVADANPFRTIYESLNTQDKDRVFGNIALTAHLAKNLSLDVRSGIDWSDDFRTQRRPYLTNGYDKGFYREQTVRSMEMNSDFMLRYQNYSWFNKRLGFSAMLGANNLATHYYNTKITLENLGEEGVYNTSNSVTGESPTLSNYRTEKVVNSVYGLAALSWDDMYYLDITGRNDWSSTLSASNRSYFYPSVAASILVDKVLHFNEKQSWVDMMKLRLAWANVGGDTKPYSLIANYSSSSSYSGSYVLPSTIPDPNIRPENVESWELGVDFRLFKSRIRFDAAVYSASTTDQIYNTSVDQIVGAASYTLNTGEISNKGIELSLGFTPVKTKDFTWDFDFNWFKNKQVLKSIIDGWDASVPLQTDMGTTIGSRVYVYSFVGQEMHKIYGKGYQRAPQGANYTDSNGKNADASGMCIVDSNGYPVLDNSPTREIGKVSPDWKAGMTQRFRYKNLSLAGTFTGQMGGRAYSVTNFALSYIGKLKNSLEGRNDGLVHKGVNQITNSDGSVSYRENTTVTSSIQTYYNTYVWNRDNVESNTFSTSFLKLKEVRLDYNLPASLCKKTGFLQGASFGIFATNVFCITKFPQYDPEVGSLNGNDSDGAYIMQGIETMSMPMTRTLGCNVKFSF